MKKLSSKGIILGIIILFIGTSAVPSINGDIGQYRNGTFFNDYSVGESINPCSLDNYDMAIIAPNSFSNVLEPLIQHKNNHGINTFVKTVEEIYDEYNGRDDSESIKLFIRNAMETLNIQYVLLVGDIDIIPMRIINFYCSFVDLGALTDLYYADVYDENMSFCSWDADNDGIFGEAEYYTYPWPDYLSNLSDLNTNNIDNVDLYPDVYLGRLPCSNINEVNVVVNKIIRYETETYNKEWFKRIILVGGDTFPPCLEQVVEEPYGLYEGEVTNQEVASQLADFEKIKLWTSLGNCNAMKFNNVLNSGAGFLSFSGHGLEIGWSTYRPDEMDSSRTINYRSLFLNGLKNNEKLPIAFFDACLTSKLDFNQNDLKKYYPNLVNLLVRIGLIDDNPEALVPCFAWNLVKMEGGGSIASVGSTRWGFVRVDKESGTYGGLSYLNILFFKAYHEGITLGEMFTKAICGYINDLTKGFRLLENMVLIGDPSLKIGGYS